MVLDLQNAFFCAAFCACLPVLQIDAANFTIKLGTVVIRTPQPFMCAHTKTINTPFITMQEELANSNLIMKHFDFNKKFSS